MEWKCLAADNWGLKIRALVAVVFLLSIGNVAAQGQVKTKPVPEYHIKRTSEKIVLDGVLSEQVWQSAEVADSFYMSFPNDTSYAKSQTQVMVTFDNDGIYIAATCFDYFPEKDYVVQSLRRDFSYPRNDAFAVYIDPLKDAQNGFNFTVSPFGVQREGLITNGGGFGVTTSWDNKWYSNAKIYDKYWIVEMFIPYKSIRYRPDKDVWGINFSRNDLKRNENSSWAPVPRVFNIAVLNFCGKLIWDNLPPKAGSNISLIPYNTVRYSVANGSGEKPDLTYNGGGEVKVGVSSSLNLELTVNPDFSEADVDDQVINLERFNLFFPERRTFFQENSDLFATFGFSRIRPFFSRRIGLDSGQVLPIYAGARLTGKIDAKWRMGVMDLQAQTLRRRGEVAENASQNFGVVALQRQVGKASNFGIIGVNRQRMGTEEVGSPFNRLLGVEYNLLSADNKWHGKVFYQHTFDSGARTAVNPFAHASWISYSDKHWNIAWNHEFVGQDYNAEVGFTQRSNYWRAEDWVYYHIYPKSKIINRHSPFVYYSGYYNTQFVENDANYKVGYNIDFQSSAILTAEVTNQYLLLTAPFDPSGSGGKKYEAGETFNYSRASIHYYSNFRKPFYIDARIAGGEYYEGTLFQVSGNMSYRFQPYVTLGLRADYNDITQPGPYSSSKLLLVGPRIETSFTKALFFTVYSQYNEQQDNVNMNMRLQWRYSPMSDIFIVYSGDYTDDSFSAKHHNVILKGTFWLNL